MPQNKKPLKLDYCELLGQDEKETARELEKKFPAWGRLPQQDCAKPYAAVAWVALHPGILREREQFAAECRDFASCFARYTDEVIEALALVRKLAKRRDAERAKRSLKDAQTQRGRVVRFLSRTASVARKKGELVPMESLTASDYDPRTRQLKPSVKVVHVAKLHDGEVAAYLSAQGDNVTIDGAKEARRFLSKGKENGTSRAK